MNIKATILLSLTLLILSSELLSEKYYDKNIMNTFEEELENMIDKENDNKIETLYYNLTRYKAQKFEGNLLTDNEKKELVNLLISNRGNYLNRNDIVFELFNFIDSKKVNDFISANKDSYSFIPDYFSYYNKIPKEYRYKILDSFSEISISKNSFSINFPSYDETIYKKIIAILDKNNKVSVLEDILSNNFFIIPKNERVRLLNILESKASIKNNDSYSLINFFYLNFNKLDTEDIKKIISILKKNDKRKLIRKYRFIKTEKDLTINELYKKELFLFSINLTKKDLFDFSFIFGDYYTAILQNFDYLDKKQQLKFRKEIDENLNYVIKNNLFETLTGEIASLFDNNFDFIEKNVQIKIIKQLKLLKTEGAKASFFSVVLAGANRYNELKDVLASYTQNKEDLILISEEISQFNFYLDLEEKNRKITYGELIEKIYKIESDTVKLNLFRFLFMNYNYLDDISKNIVKNNLSNPFAIQAYLENLDKENEKYSEEEKDAFLAFIPYLKYKDLLQLEGSSFYKHFKKEIWEKANLIKDSFDSLEYEYYSGFQDMLKNAYPFLSGELKDKVKEVILESISREISYPHFKITTENKELVKFFISKLFDSDINKFLNLFVEYYELFTKEEQISYINKISKLKTFENIDTIPIGYLLRNHIEDFSKETLEENVKKMFKDSEGRLFILDLLGKSYFNISKKLEKEIVTYFYSEITNYFSEISDYLQKNKNYTTEKDGVIIGASAEIFFLPSETNKLTELKEKINSLSINGFTEASNKISSTISISKIWLYLDKQQQQNLLEKMKLIPIFNYKFLEYFNDKEIEIFIKDNSIYHMSIFSSLLEKSDDILDLSKEKKPLSNKFNKIIQLILESGENFEYSFYILNRNFDLLNTETKSKIIDFLKNDKNFEKYSEEILLGDKKNELYKFVSEKFLLKEQVTINSFWTYFKQDNYRDKYYEKINSNKNFNKYNIIFEALTNETNQQEKLELIEKYSMSKDLSIYALFALTQIIDKVDLERQKEIIDNCLKSNLNNTIPLILIIINKGQHIHTFYKDKLFEYAKSELFSKYVAKFLFETYSSQTSYEKRDLIVKEILETKETIPFLIALGKYKSKEIVLLMEKYKKDIYFINKVLDFFTYSSDEGINLVFEKALEIDEDLIFKMPLYLRNEKFLSKLPIKKEDILSKINTISNKKYSYEEFIEILSNEHDYSYIYFLLKKWYFLPNELRNKLSKDIFNQKTNLNMIPYISENLTLEKNIFNFVLDSSEAELLYLLLKKDKNELLEDYSNILKRNFYYQRYTFFWEDKIALEKKLIFTSQEYKSFFITALFKDFLSTSYDANSKNRYFFQYFKNLSEF